MLIFTHTQPWDGNKTAAKLYEWKRCEEKKDTSLKTRLWSEKSGKHYTPTGMHLYSNLDKRYH